MMKTMSLILALVKMLTLLSVGISAETLSRDVPEKHWAYESIAEVNEAGLMIGRGTPKGIVFDPAGEITGYEIYMTLWRIAGTPELETENKPFINIQETVKDKWYSDSYEWAIYGGIANVSCILGSSDIPEGGISIGRIGSSVCPAEKFGVLMSNKDAGRTATRTDVILSLYYYMTTYLDVDVTVDADMSKFSDWNLENIENKEGDPSTNKEGDPSTNVQYGNILWSYTDEFVPAWEWAVGSGIIKGCGDGTLQMGEYDSKSGTQRFVTRAEYAVILDRFTDYCEKLK